MTGVSTFVLTDAGNAERFAADHGAYLRWVPEWTKWVRFDGQRWRKVTETSITDLAIASARKLYAVASDPSIERDLLSKVVTWAKASESRGKIDAAIALARGMLETSGREFDRDPYLLNVGNRTLDLRANVVREHRRGDMITKVAGCDFDADATAPTFARFIAHVLPDDLRAFVQRFLGMCLTGDVSAQALALFLGLGANGKSTLVEAVMHVLGEYAAPGAPDLLLAKHGEAHPTEQADLEGLRLVVCQEVEVGRQWAERSVKALTGGDLVKARRMRCDFFTFVPTHKLVVCANTRPRVRGADEGIWRRLKVVLFGVTVPRAERDPHLPDKLRAEASGILNWLLEGCQAWQRDGLGEPSGVTAATDDYRAEQDALGPFVAERCDVVDGAFTPTVELYGAYASWCASQGAQAWSREAFCEGLRERGFGPKRTNAARGITGLRLRPLGRVTGDSR